MTKWSDDNIIDYLMDEMTPLDQDSFEKSLAQSEKLRSRVVENETIVRSVAKAPAPKWNKDLTASIMAQCVGESTAKRASSTFSYWKMLAASILAILSIYFYNTSQTDKNNLTTIAQQPAEKAAVKKLTDVENKAVTWLIDAQETTGQWSAQKWGGQKGFDVGLTGLALMALEGQEGERIKKARDSAVGYLIHQQQGSGMFGHEKQGASYNHALATLALMNHEKTMTERSLYQSVTKAVKYIVDSQGHSGGWGYFQIPESVNTSITLWQLNVLAVAKAKGLNTVDHSLTKGKEYLASNIDSQGRTGYSQGENFKYGHESLTAMSSYFLRIFGQKPQENMPSVSSLLASHEGQHKNFYRDYFVVSAGDIEKVETGKILSELENTQVRGGDQLGSWRPDDVWGNAGGRVYATAMAAMSFQVHERTQRTMALLHHRH